MKGYFKFIGVLEIFCTIVVFVKSLFSFEFFEDAFGVLGAIIYLVFIGLILPANGVLFLACAGNRENIENLWADKEDKK